jgi:hypothetical protein
VLKPLNAALGGWKPHGGTGRDRDPVEVLSSAWSEIVGPDVAQSCRPLRIVDTTLLIATRSSAWSQQLSFLADQILFAVRAALPDTKVRQLRFRVGRLPADRAARPAAGQRPITGRNPAAQALAPSTGVAETVARFRSSVEARKRAKRAAGWKDCEGCAASIAPGGGAFCITCANARTEEHIAAVARLMFEAPWLGFAGTAALVEGLTQREYESIRARLLARWWETLARARAAKRLSRDGRERLIASSYVLLKSKLSPDAIAPATVRNVLGDELHDLIYGTEQQTKTNG